MWVYIPQKVDREALISQKMDLHQTKNGRRSPFFVVAKFLKPKLKVLACVICFII